VLAGSADFGVNKGRRNLLLDQARAVIAFDQQSDPAAGIDVPRPA
jgi:hypothetical protein